MMRRTAFPAMLAATLLVAGCVEPGLQYQPSQKSAVELRSMQSRVVMAASDTAMRDVIETMHDLGYRITRVSADAGTVSGTRASTLRLAAIVEARGEGESAVRANASILSPTAEAQVDSPEFYQRNFFEPLGVTMGRSLKPVSAAEAMPEAPRPIAEVNTIAEREAKAREQADISE